jgi:hypothetical protein
MNKITRNAITCLILIVLIVSAVEAASYVFNMFSAKRFGRADLDQTAVLPTAWRSFELNRTYGVGAPPDREKYYRTHNAQGFKYPREVSKQKAPNTVRIIAMGGSTLYGWGSEGLTQYGNHFPLANDETITYFLEKLLNEKLAGAAQVEVLNAGIPNYDSSHHLAYWNETLFEYEPDLVIFVDGNNELYGGTLYNPMRDNRNGATLVVDSFNERGLSFTLYVAARYFAQYSELAKSVQYGLMNRWQTERPPTLANYQLPATFDGFDALYDQRARFTFMRTYTQIKAALDFANAQMIFFLQPQMMLENPDVLSPADLATRREVFVTWSSPTGQVDRAELMSRIRLKIPGYMKQIGVEYHDIGTVGSSTHKDESLYIDYTHLTAGGSKAAAEQMLAPTLARVTEVLRHRGASVHN